MKKKNNLLKGKGFLPFTLLPLILSRHPDQSLQRPWNYYQLGLFLLPIIPSVGGVMLCIAMFITFFRKYKVISRRPLNRGLVLLSLLFIISSAIAENQGDAFLGAFNFLPFFLLFASFSTLVQTFTQLRQISWLLTIPSGAVVILGLGQLFLGWATNPPGQPTILGWELVSGGNPLSRMASVFMHANVLAGYFVIVFIVALGLLLSITQKLIPKLGGKQGTKEDKEKTSLSGLDATGLDTSKLDVFGSNIYVTIFLTIIVALDFLGLILTNSRNAWSIALGACFIYAVYLGWRLIVATVTAIATSVLLAAFAPSPIAELFRKFVPAFFWARFNDQLFPDRPVASLRTVQWEFAWSMTTQRPFTGWGLRNFSQIYQAKMNFPLNHPHNLYLMLSAETGIPATLLFCSLVGFVLFKAVEIIRKTRDIKPEDRLIFFSYVAVFFGLVIFNTVDITIFDIRLNLLSWIILSAICGVVYRMEKINTISEN